MMFLSQSDFSVCQVDIFRVTVSFHDFPCVHLFLVYTANFQSYFCITRSNSMGYYIIIQLQVFLYTCLINTGLCWENMFGFTSGCYIELVGFLTLWKWRVFCYTGVFLSETQKDKTLYIKLATNIYIMPS